MHGHEAEALQDLPRLLGGEVRLVEAGDAGENLLRRIPPAADDDVVLPDRIREHSCYGFFDACGIELEDVARDRESRHTGIVFCDPFFSEVSLSDEPSYMSSVA